MNINPKISQEWQALSSFQDILFYNKKANALENMAFKNDFEKFFIIIWQYLNGYTKNSDEIIGAINNLLDRSLTQIKPSDLNAGDKGAILARIYIVRNKILPSMISQFEKRKEKAKSLAADILNIKVENLIAGLKAVNDISKGNDVEGKSYLNSSEEAKNTFQAEGQTTSKQEKILNGSKAETILQNILSTFGSSPPPAPIAPPLVLDPELEKQKKIQELTQEVEKEKLLLKYYRLLELKNNESYRKYDKAKQNWKVVLEKEIGHQEFLENVSLERLKETIEDIEKQINTKDKEKNVVTIRQGGILNQFELAAAKKFQEECKQLHLEIINTQDQLKEYTEKKRIFSEVFINEELTCGGLDREIESNSQSFRKLIEEDNGKGLKFHEGRLFQIENQIRKLTGQEPLVNPSSGKTEKPFKVMKTEVVADKNVAADIAQQAAKSKAVKEAMKPDLMKL